MAPPPAAEMRPEPLETRYTLEVGVDLALPRGLGELRDAAQDGDAGVVHEDVDRTPCRQRLVGHPPDLVRVGEVRGHRERRAAFPADRVGNARGARAVEVDANDRCPLFGEALRGLAADARGGAGYEGALASQSHPGFPIWVPSHTADNNGVHQER